MWVCAGGGFGMWVCLVWWMWVCADLSGYVFFFFLGGVGGCGFVPVVVVGLCLWWVWDVGLFGLVNVGLCRSLWLWFFFFFFFLRWRWWM